MGLDQGLFLTLPAFLGELHLKSVLRNSEEAQLVFLGYCK